ncbi:hypothetical protein ACNAT0_22330, partial [Escherichia coli]|uniref:hypothetical protein n=1 Tax=Escherichia coli TaxID=562 RepID=UPI003A4DB170
LLRQKQKKLIMLPSETMIWQPEFTDKTLSRKPGAVQSGSDSENCKNAKEGLFRYKQLHPKHVDYKDAFKNVLGKDGS